MSPLSNKVLHYIFSYHDNSPVYHSVMVNQVLCCIFSTDIDHIEICSDDAASVDGEAVDISKRKTYNYRVVMIRDGVQMDMRGRCSAGQKVSR